VSEVISGVGFGHFGYGYHIYSIVSHIKSYLKMNVVVMMIHHCNCLLFIMIPPVVDVHMMLKKRKIMQEEG